MATWVAALLQRIRKRNCLSLRTWLSRQPHAATPMLLVTMPQPRSPSMTAHTVQMLCDRSAWHYPSVLKRWLSFPCMFMSM